MDEKTSVLVGTIGSIFLGVIAAALAWILGKDTLTGNNKEIVRQMLNFEISLMIVSFVLAIIPFVGVVLALIVWVVNIIFCVKAFLAHKNNVEFKAPSFINVQ